MLGRTLSRAARMLLTGAIAALALTLWSMPHAPIAGMQAQQADPGAVAAQYQAAIGSGDYDAAVALFSDDMVAREPFGTFVSRETLGIAFDAFAAGQPGLRITMEQPAVTLTTAVYRMTIASDTLRSIGTDRVVFVETLVVVDGKIVTLTAVPDMTDAATAQFVNAARSG